MVKLPGLEHVGWVIVPAVGAEISVTVMVPVAATLPQPPVSGTLSVSYTHLRAHETS